MTRRRRPHHLRIHLRRGHPVAAGPDRPGEAPTPHLRRPDDVLVLVAPPLAERLVGLATALGPGYSVEPGLPAAGTLAVLRAATPAAIAFWRGRHPSSGLFVVDPFGEHSAAECLEAGADAYVAGPVTTAEVAAILQSLARRLVTARVPA